MPCYSAYHDPDLASHGDDGALKCSTLKSCDDHNTSDVDDNQCSVVDRHDSDVGEASRLAFDTGAVRQADIGALQVKCLSLLQLLFNQTEAAEGHFDGEAEQQRQSQMRSKEVRQLSQLAKSESRSKS